MMIMDSYMYSKLSNLFVLLQDHRVNIPRFLRDLHLTEKDLDDWKNRMVVPNGAVLVDVARYLGTSLEYLIGEIDDPYAYTKERVLLSLLDQFIDIFNSSGLTHYEVAEIMNLNPRLIADMKKGKSRAYDIYFLQLVLCLKDAVDRLWGDSFHAPWEDK